MIKGAIEGGGGGSEKQKGFAIRLERDARCERKRVAQHEFTKAGGLAVMYICIRERALW